MLAPVSATLIEKFLMDLSIQRDYKLVSMTEGLKIFEKDIMKDGISMEERIIIDTTLLSESNDRIDIEKFFKMLNIEKFKLSRDIVRLLISCKMLPENYKYSNEDNGKVINDTLIIKEGRRVIYKLYRIHATTALFRAKCMRFSCYFANMEIFTNAFTKYQLQLELIKKRKSNQVIDTDKTFKTKKTMKELDSDFINESKVVATSILKSDYATKKLDNLKKMNAQLNEAYKALNIEIAIKEKRIKRKMEIIKKLQKYIADNTV